MPVVLTVSDVRQALSLSTGLGEPDSAGPASTAALGRLFHRVMSGLCGDDPNESAVALVADLDADADLWGRELVQHAWQRLFGPRLREQQAALQTSAAQVLRCWQATESACQWLARILWTASTQGAKPGTRTALRLSLLPEESLGCELREPGWTDSVRLEGVCDLIVETPHNRAWCLVEFKTGRALPEVDLAQACLYHILRTHAGELGRTTSDSEAIAVVRFTPKPQELVFTAESLSTSKAELLTVIGRLAGVIPEKPREAAPAAPAIANGKAPAEPAPRQQPGPAEREPVSSIDRTARTPVRFGEVTDEHRLLGRRLQDVLREYNAPVQIEGDPVPGPSFLRFVLRLGRGVKFKAVADRTAEIQVRLNLAYPPFISTEKGQLVVDLQRPDRRYVGLADVLDQLPVPDPLLGSSLIPVGIDLEGGLRTADLSRPEHCHLLVAGTTGSGKSEWLRSAIASLLLRNTPATLRLALIDPKRNAFTSLQGSPYLHGPIVFSAESGALDVLENLGDEMDNRYARFSGDADLATWMRRTGESVPRIVCVIDEYADLVTLGPKERKAIETAVARLGAKARAAGVHLLIATQQPSRQVIEGRLKTVMPARVGLRTSEAIESRMLLGTPGAENLLGNGDLLFKDLSPLARLQSPYIAPDEWAHLTRSAIRDVDR